MPPAALTLKEQKFVTAYLTASSIKETAISAGYLSNPSSQGCRVLNRKRVQNAIQAEQQRLQETFELSTDTLTRNLLAAYDRARSDSDVMGMIRAVRELGLLCGLYNHAETVEHEAPIDLNRLSDSELKKLVDSAEQG